MDTLIAGNFEPWRAFIVLAVIGLAHHLHEGEPMGGIPIFLELHPLAAAVVLAAAALSASCLLTR